MRKRKLVKGIKILLNVKGSRRKDTEDAKGVPKEQPKPKFGDNFFGRNKRSRAAKRGDSSEQSTEDKS